MKAHEAGRPNAVRRNSVSANDGNVGSGAADHSELAEATATTWTFLGNHAHALFCLASDPESRLRDIAVRVGITERAVSRILTELEESGVIQKERVGRRNHYTVNHGARLRHSLESHASVGDLLTLLDPEK